jgi:hypothetical protein
LFYDCGKSEVLADGTVRKLSMPRRVGAEQNADNIENFKTHRNPTIALAQKLRILCPDFQHFPSRVVAKAGRAMLNFVLP